MFDPTFVVDSFVDVNFGFVQPPGQLPGFHLLNIPIPSISDVSASMARLTEWEVVVDAAHHSCH